MGHKGFIFVFSVQQVTTDFKPVDERKRKTTCSIPFFILADKHGGGVMMIWVAHSSRLDTSFAIHFLNELV